MDEPLDLISQETQSDDSLLAFCLNSTFHRNDSFTRAVQGDDEEDSASKSVGSSEDEDCTNESDQLTSKFWFEAGRVQSSLDLDEFRSSSRRLSVLKEESEDSESAQSVSIHYKSETQHVIQMSQQSQILLSTATASPTILTFESSKQSACSRSQDSITVKDIGNQSLSKKPRHELSRHFSDDPFLTSDLNFVISRHNGSVDSPSGLSRSTSRPLFLANSSTNSLCSSSTLLPNSPSDSEITDLETDEVDADDVFGSVSLLIDPHHSDHDPFDPPQVSISSCDSTDPCSISIYESPVSSFNESPTSSPSYVTPMERSPWASPQSSIKGFSPTGSVKSPQPPSPLTGQLLRVKSPASGLVSGEPVVILKRCQSVKSKDDLSSNHVPDRGEVSPFSVTTFSATTYSNLHHFGSTQTKPLKLCVRCSEQNIDDEKSTKKLLDHNGDGTTSCETDKLPDISRPKNCLLSSGSSDCPTPTNFTPGLETCVTEDTLEGLNEDGSLKFADDSDVDTESEKSAN